MFETLIYGVESFLILIGQETNVLFANEFNMESV